MINEDFDEFIQAEARHKSVYLGSDQKNAHKKKIKKDENSRGNTDSYIGATGRDVFDK
ncbi:MULTISPECIES: hypothetical protein [Bacillaceae]|uniref:hypothetical protein n=1 Tax=Metabacillus sp. 22489 TaxID=3453928 RepID=UPI001483AB47